MRASYKPLKASIEILLFNTYIYIYMWFGIYVERKYVYVYVSYIADYDYLLIKTTQK